MQTKGFTLVEMLVTLSILSIFILILPLLRPNARIQLRYETSTLKERLLLAQSEAISQKKAKYVDFHGNAYTIAGQTYDMNTSISCQGSSFHFTPQGTISNALTLRCSCAGQGSELVIQLGTGRMYAK